jgi:CheY-like chemotaxis protein
MTESGNVTPPEDRQSAMDQAQQFAQDLAAMRSARGALQSRLAAANRRRILIADDDVAMRGLVKATLEADHYEVLEAGRGTEAIMLARSEHPEVILLDVHMPDMDGLEVCREVRKDSSLKDIPIVMLSSAAHASDVQAGLDAGANRYLTKPFSPLQLLDVMQWTLTKRD